MAPAAIQDEPPASESIDAVGKPPAGIVLPPKDIRGLSNQTTYEQADTDIKIAIVEKTAGYVARNGTVFEGELNTV